MTQDPAPPADGRTSQGGSRAATAPGRRCPWAESSPAMAAYHDLEWGVPSRDDRHLFEMLVLEGAQAGLSWSTILGKREAYRRAFAGFDPVAVARFGETEIERLLADPGIVRNRAKVQSAVSNAARFLEVAETSGTFASWLWGLAGSRVVNHPLNADEVPASTALSERVAKEMRRRGFSFVGSTIAYSYLQSVGIVDDHLVGCPAKLG
ncbi:MAG TPA: DNA-3-methyladenine glycosylase I [Acidimicrobiales bacterium]|nr:DNA-3-methyladenine glycosylase I [Acidimicrobiales bacterium]